jgi:GTPase SAR1 family protein
MDFHSSNGTWKGSITMTNGTLALYNVSDARQKQDVKATGINALKMLNELPVVDFAYTKSPDARHTGYIAQDAQKVLSEMVIYNERDDTYAVSTSQLIPVLHKAILEQQKTIEMQEKRIEALEAAINKLVGK